MSQRNINVLIGVVLLALATTWISLNDLNYKVPQGPDGGQLTAESPWWARLLFWQGDQERSIRVHRGLDLVGGTQVVLEATQTEGTDATELEGMMKAARVVIENRVSGGLGVIEPLVQQEGARRIIVELPEVKDPDQAIALIKETGRLEFVEALRFPLKEGDRIITSMALDLAEGTLVTDTFTYPDRVFPTVMTGANLQDAAVDFDQAGRRSIAFTLTDEGQKIFSVYTKDHVNDFLAITLDGVVVSAPRIEAHITTKTGQITSGAATGFEQKEAEDMVIKLKYGAIPVPMQVVENRTVGPSLGQESLQKSLRAGFIGIALVLLFLLITYRIPGVLIMLSVLLYGVINFSVYKLAPVTLTVPALAGFIISVGMTADASILVFERMKEELRAGRRLSSAAEMAFTRAWPSIRDGNLSTLITCFILFWFGTNFGASVVKGFAVTLAIGMVVNLFTAVTATRAIMRLTIALFGKTMEDNLALWVGYRPEPANARIPDWARNAFHIVKHRKWYYIFSAAIIVPGLIFMAISMARFGAPLRLSIDYTGGSLWEMDFAQPVSSLDVVEFLHDSGDANATAQSVEGDNIVLVRTRDLTVEEKTDLSAKLKAKFGDFDERRFETIGPTIGEEVTRASGIAVSVAAVVLLFFIWFAFRTVANPIRYGVSAVVAMLHDLLVIAGLYSLAGLVWGWEADTLFLTAILTIVGYSVSDTIVVFDRLRENLPRRRAEPFETVAARSLLETIHRSLATTLLALFAIGAVMVYGGETTQKFTAVLFVGLASAAYSSLFNASPILVSWNNGELASFFGLNKKPKAGSGN